MPSSNVVTCTKGVDGKLYYFRNGKRVKASDVAKPPSKCTKSKAMRVGGKTCPQGYTKVELVALTSKARIMTKEDANKYSKEELCKLLAKEAKKKKSPTSSKSKKSKSKKASSRPYLEKLAIPTERRIATPVRPSPKFGEGQIFLWKAKTGSEMVDYAPMPSEFVAQIDRDDLGETISDLGLKNQMYVYFTTKEANYRAEKSLTISTDDEAIAFVELSYPRMKKDMVVLSATPKRSPRGIRESITDVMMA